jgi:hypothetical protein
MPHLDTLWIVKSISPSAGSMYLPHYAGTTREEVEQKVRASAQRLGYKGNVENRLHQQNWRIVLVKITEMKSR